MAVKLSLSNLNEIARLGEEIYQGRYRERYEREHPEKFVAIDVNTESAYLGATPEEALDKALSAAPDGAFHLVQVGFPGAFRVAYTSHGSSTVARIL